GGAEPLKRALARPPRMEPGKGSPEGRGFIERKASPRGLVRPLAKWYDRLQEVRIMPQSPICASRRGSRASRVGKFTRFAASAATLCAACAHGIDSEFDPSSRDGGSTTGQTTGPGSTVGSGGASGGPTNAGSAGRADPTGVGGSSASTGPGSSSS